MHCSTFRSALSVVVALAGLTTSSLADAELR